MTGEGRGLWESSFKPNHPINWNWSFNWIFNFLLFTKFIAQSDVSLGITLYSEINLQTVPLGITVIYDLFFETIWHFGTNSNLRIFVFFGNSHGGQGER